MTPAELMEMGLRLFPVTQRKRPAITGWQKYAVCATIDDIRNDWRNGARAFGIYLFPSRIVVLDADNENANNWAEAHLPDTPMMTVTKRGAHRYYRLQDGAAAPKDNRPLAGIALDRKAKGYVIAPGSVIGGFEYKETSFWDTPMCELPEYPSHLFPVERIVEPCSILIPDIPMDATCKKIIKWYIDNGEDSVEGDNGSRVMKRAASFFVNGLALGLDEARACMVEWNIHRAKPMWNDREIEHALNTSAKEGAANGRPRGWAYKDWANA